MQASVGQDRVADLDCFVQVLEAAASVQGNARAKKWEWVGREVGGEGMEDFWDSIGNVIEENM